MPLMHHPKLKTEYMAQSAGQVRVMKKSGWVEGPLPKKNRPSSPVAKPSKQGDREDG